jgi:hypothetical protein
VRRSVGPNGTTLLPLEVFLSNLIFENFFEKKGVTWIEMERTVKDREKWKTFWDPLYTRR